MFREYMNALLDLHRLTAYTIGCISRSDPLTDNLLNSLVRALARQDRARTFCEIITMVTDPIPFIRERRFT